MRCSPGVRFSKIFALRAFWLATVAVLMVCCADAKQEIDPAWYDPWAVPKAMLHQAQKRTDDQGNPTKKATRISSASPETRKSKQPLHKAQPRDLKGPKVFATK